MPDLRTSAGLHEKIRYVQNLLQRALEREREHEDDKKRQMRQIPLRPDERDW